MTSLATTVALAGALVLLWAGLEKARDPGSPILTLRALGVPPRVAALGVLVIPAELAVGVALVFRPDSAWTQGGVLVLAGAFAIAGLLALRRDVRVHCACFGAGRGGYLGAHQLVALVPWMATVAVVNAAELQAPSPSEASSRLAGVALTMAGVRLVTVFGPWHAARSDRRSARETYVWLHR